MKQKWTESRYTKKLLTKQTLFFALLCLCVNILFAHIATWLKLPLFLDCIGTIVGGTLLGYLPGIVIGFATNLLNAIQRSDYTLLRTAQHSDCNFCNVFFRQRIVQKMVGSHRRSNDVHSHWRRVGFGADLVVVRLQFRYGYLCAVCNFDFWKRTDESVLGAVHGGYGNRHCRQNCLRSN